MKVTNNYSKDEKQNINKYTLLKSNNNIITTLRDFLKEWII